MPCLTPAGLASDSADSRKGRQDGGTSGGGELPSPVRPVGLVEREVRWSCRESAGGVGQRCAAMFSVYDLQRGDAIGPVLHVARGQRCGLLEGAERGGRGFRPLR